MSKAAGTLISTNQATYIHPRFQPCLDGQVSTLLKFTEGGEHYVAARASHLQDYRNHSAYKGSQSQEGDRPSFFVSDQRLAMDACSRKWDRHEQCPRYKLYHQDQGSKKERITLSKNLCAHRDQYADMTGKIHPLRYFQLPVPLDEQIRNNSPYINRAFRFTDSINTADWGRQIHLIKVRPHKSLHVATEGDRRNRTLYCVNRVKYPRLSNDHYC